MMVRFGKAASIGLQQAFFLGGHWSRHLNFIQFHSISAFGFVENANTPGNSLGYQNSNYQNCIFFVYTQPFGIQCHISKCHVICWCWTSQFYRPDKMGGSLYSLHIFILFWHICFGSSFLIIRSTYVQELDQGNICGNPYMYLAYMSCIAKKYNFLSTFATKPIQCWLVTATPAGYVPRSDGGGKSGGSWVCYLKVGLFEIGQHKIDQDWMKLLYNEIRR